MALGEKKQRVRNADKARSSFVTRRTETKLSALADLFKGAAGERWDHTETGVLQRTLYYRDFRYLDSLRLVYNWENRFMAVNYNLQIITPIYTEAEFREVGDCQFRLHCRQKSLKGKRDFQWSCEEWSDSEEELDRYQERLAHPLILERLDALDLFEMEITHRRGNDYWRISTESLIGSATWMLIPPVLSMVTPKLEECVKFYELYELLGDALANNRQKNIPEGEN